jgi:hypothetical protein
MVFVYFANAICGFLGLFDLMSSLGLDLDHQTLRKPVVLLPFISVRQNLPRSAHARWHFLLGTEAAAVVL